MHIKHSVHPPFLSAMGEGGWASDQIFKKWEGGFTGSWFLEGGCWERGGWLFLGEGGCSFYIKNKLKSEIFNKKKSLQTKMFFSVITKNLNWEILTKNLVTFKRWDEAKDEKF